MILDNSNEIQIKNDCTKCVNSVHYVYLFQNNTYCQCPVLQILYPSLDSAGKKVDFNSLD